MSSKEDRVLSAIESIKLVAKALHTPFDTSELEAAVKELVGDRPKVEDERPAPVEQRAPIGVPKDSVK